MISQWQRAPLSYLGSEFGVDCVSRDEHANHPYAIPVTLDDLHIDCLHADIVSRAWNCFVFVCFFGCVVSFIYDFIIITVRCLVTLTDFTFDDLSQSCAPRWALFTLAGCMFIFGGGGLLIRKCFECILKEN